MKKTKRARRPIWNSLVKVTCAGLSKSEKVFLEAQMNAAIHRIAAARMKWGKYRDEE